jgi:DNA mismatch endonuclease (patch repair protein)
MPDVFTKSKRSEVMSRIRGRGNKDTELALAALLRAHRITGWRRQVLVRVTVEGSLSRVEGKQRQRNSQRSTFNSQLTVRPDFVFPKTRTVIFVDGCFWHGCPKHATRPKNNREFWRRKLSANKTRDALVTRVLRHSGWRVLRVWEHELARKNEARLVGRIQRVLG